MNKNIYIVINFFEYLEGNIGVIEGKYNLGYYIEQFPNIKYLTRNISKLIFLFDIHETNVNVSNYLNWKVILLL
jgi:hypothetical protein